ncbi:hypothetical protein L484_022815 [Morus notabilis]|uniref:Uncharacterized protein n=1 Tax=Morus notabilis TaxID=981085 RepID=W9SD67_9ROSA|nr:hypothetical protein L484_022815 [Morus notabilis]
MASSVAIIHCSRLFPNGVPSASSLGTKSLPKSSPVAFNGVRSSLKKRHEFPNRSDGAARSLRFSSGFSQMGSREISSRSEISVQSSTSDSSGSATSTVSQNVFGILHLIVSLGTILAVDKFLKKAFAAAAIKFPSALFGMFCIFSVLVILDSTVPAAAKRVMDFFEPALLFIQRWLPLYYVPSLVVLPLSVKDIPAASGIKICYITVGGWLATLCIAGFTAIAVRKLVKTEMVDAEPMAKPSPFSALEIWSWSGILVISFVSALLYPTVLGTGARTCLPFLLASTVLGYMVGSGLPSGIKKVFHPIICCALSADLTALAFGYLSRSGLNSVLGTNSSLTAAVVVVTGLVGANFVQATLDKLRFRDPIARGIATASSAHGLGTAALSAKEPEALPFCAIAYALNGIFGSVLCSIPAIRQSLLAVVG